MRQQKENTCLQWHAKADHEVLEHILPELEQRLQSSTCSRTTQQRLQLIAEELMTNTIKYGYPDQPRGSFTLAINIHQTNAEIIYTDDGIPFDPTHPPKWILDSVLRTDP